MSEAKKAPVALAIAGSDSGGGAGLQADLAAFRTFGCFGTSAITALTAQHPGGVSGVEGVDPQLVQKQIRAVFDSFKVAAAKTGMLWDRPQMEALFAVWPDEGPALVVDPVMVATSGARLLKPEAEECMRDRICPLATLVTPNLEEAEVLLGKPVQDDPVAAADQLAELLGTGVLLKGGHLHDSSHLSADVLVSKEGRYLFSSPRLGEGAPHGTGCTLAAGITANLALGRSLVEAVGWAKGLVNGAIANAQPSAFGPSVSTVVSLADISPVEPEAL